MTNYQDNNTVEIDENDSVIRFSKKTDQRKCKHNRIEYSLEESEVLCLDCNTKLNPIWWIDKHIWYLNQVNQRNNRILAEYREIDKKLKKKCSYLCTKCHEVNNIDFTSLPSKAAVVRGMAVVDEDFDGMKIEVVKR